MTAVNRLVAHPDPHHPITLAENLVDQPIVLQFRSTGQRGPLVRFGQQHRVDLVLAGQQCSAENICGDGRFEFGDIGGREQFEDETIGQPAGDVVDDRLLANGLHQEQQPGAGIELDVDAGEFLEFGGQVGESRVAFDQEITKGVRQALGGLVQRLATSSGGLVDHPAAQADRFTDRPESASRRRGGSAGTMAVDDQHLQVATRQFPGGGMSRHATAGNHHVDR